MKVVNSREIKKAITILKQCQAKLNQLDAGAFESWGVEGFCEQLDDDIFDLEQELEDARESQREDR